MAEKRSIFEEVKEAGGRAGPVLTAVGAIDRAKGARRGIRLWLMLLAALVSAMILVGGLTRLTDSGLAITEWKPVMGALPPLSEADWQAAFGRYQATEEFRAQNNAMTLAEFKPLYWWEWSHRQLGRVIGLVWAVGFFGFLAARRIPVGWTRRLLLVGVLGGVQGAVGWWMVTSGLTGTALDVASTRLAVHLGLAFAILGLLLWYCFLMGRTEADLMKARRAGEPRLAGLATGLMHLAFLQILLGALVAGIDAGRGYTDWPLMAGRFFPEGAFDIRPLWRNFIENDGLVQFCHRIAGYLLLLAGFFAWSRGRASAHADTGRAFDLVAVALVLQVMLGIATVMNSAPLGIAICHQGGAILTWGVILRARFLARYPIHRSLRGAR
jgi:cytochrome c oxidase assembly protein subunit 15